MKTTRINIQGMTCMSCVSTVEKQLYTVEGIVEVDVNLEQGNASIKSIDDLDETLILDAVAQNGKYTASLVEATKMVLNESSSSNTSYKPLLLVVLYLLGGTLLVEWSSGMFLMETWMPNFMAGFFLVFSFFKMLDLKGFASAYSMYDIVAAKSKVYAYSFPFIELVLGISYLLIPDNAVTHLTTAIVMFVSLIGVLRAVLNKQKIQCACLGTGFNLPMSTVTIIEDGVMLIMALYMYFNAI